MRRSPHTPSRAAALPTLAVLLIAGSAGAPAQELPDGGAFVTRLGADTVAVERFAYGPDTLHAEVAIRVPETTLRSYGLALDAGGEARKLVTAVRDPGAGSDAAPLRTTTVTFGADSLEIVTTGEGEAGERTVAGDPTMLPFLEMTHWPFEVALRRAVRSGRDSTTVRMFTGRRPIPFTFRREGPGRWTISFFRGTMTAETDGEGRIASLDASGTTRALRVERVASVDVGALARAYAERDAAGEGIGALSGRGEATAEVDDARVTVDYGRPSKRGRRIFGGLVPWDEVWRTGANRATHLTTSKDLLVDDSRIPAGTYTLWTIPRPDRWTLVVNEETDIGGTSYDPSRDLLRVEMRTRPLSGVVEDFTIRVEETDDGGILRLRWDRTEAYLPFEVVPSF